jgi:hypothetical protein
MLEEHRKYDLMISVLDTERINKTLSCSSNSSSSSRSVTVVVVVLVVV